LSCMLRSTPGRTTAGSTLSITRGKSTGHCVVSRFFSCLFRIMAAHPALAICVVCALGVVVLVATTPANTNGGERRASSAATCHGSVYMCLSHGKTAVAAGYRCRRHCCYADPGCTTALYLSQTTPSLQSCRRHCGADSAFTNLLQVPLSHVLF
jgi:hypothetical protein